MLPTPHDDERQWRELMDEQQRLHVVQEQRISQVEQRITVIESVKLPTLEMTLGKLTEIAATQSKQGALNEAAIIAIRERTDQFADHMEKVTDRLTGKQDEEGGKISEIDTRLSRQETQMNVVKAIGAAIIGAAALVGLEHFIPH